MTDLRIAIVGKPNVGKSSIINKTYRRKSVLLFRILQVQQEMPSILTSNGTVRIMYLLIQPDLEESLRLRKRLKNTVLYRTVTAVERADVVIIVIDAD